MCITVKCWGTLYLSTFSIVVAVEIKLYWLQICTPQSILLYKKKAILQSWLSWQIFQATLPPWHYYY